MIECIFCNKSHNLTDRFCPFCGRTKPAESIKFELEYTQDEFRTFNTEYAKVISKYSNFQNNKHIDLRIGFISGRNILNAYTQMTAENILDCFNKEKAPTFLRIGTKENLEKFDIDNVILDMYRIHKTNYLSTLMFDTERFFKYLSIHFYTDMYTNIL